MHLFFPFDVQISHLRPVKAPSRLIKCLFVMILLVFDCFLAFWYIPGSCTFPAPVIETDSFLRGLIIYCGKWFCLPYKLILSHSREILNQNTLSTHGIQKKYKTTGRQHKKFYFLEKKLPRYYRIY